MDAMLAGCEAVVGGDPRYTHVTPEFVEAQKIDLPIWVPRQAGPFAGYGQVSSARAVAAGLTYRPLAITVAELMAWFRSLPGERQAKLNAGITREQEAEWLRLWHASRG